MPSLLIPDHCIQDGQELAHTSCNGNFFEFALRQQALIELFDNRVKSDSCERAHIEHTTHGGSSARDVTFATMLTTVVANWSDSDQQSDLSPIESPQFRQLSEQGHRKHRADTFRTLKQIVPLAPLLSLANLILQIAVEFSDPFLQPFNVLFELVSHLGE